MSSIKRDVKKKVLPRPETRCFLEIQPTVIRLPWGSLTCAHSDQSPLVSFSGSVEFARATSEWRLKVNHGSIRGSGPIAISGYPRGLCQEDEKSSCCTKDE